MASLAILVARRDFPARFLAKVNFAGPYQEKLGSRCWEWTAATREGYGRYWLNKTDKLIDAHRFAWQLLRGKIPAGLQIDHLCKNHCCVNPGHMEVVTLGVNVLRGEAPSAKARRRDHCIHGHPYISENTRLYRGSRYCRECNRAWQRRQASR